MSTTNVSPIAKKWICVVVQYVLAMNDCVSACLRRPVLNFDPWATITKWPQSYAVPHDGEGVDAGFVGVAAVVGEG